VVGSMSACFCLPLELRIHQGFRHLGVDEPHAKRQSLSLAERVVHMALAFVTSQDRPAWLVLDAFFSRWGISPGPLGVLDRAETTVSACSG
jgi:hypothetical protein